MIFYFLLKKYLASSKVFLARYFLIFAKFLLQCKPSVFRHPATCQVWKFGSFAAEHVVWKFNDTIIYEKNSTEVKTNPNWTDKVKMTEVVKLCFCSGRNGHFRKKSSGFLAGSVNHVCKSMG